MSARVDRNRLDPGERDARWLLLGALAPLLLLLAMAG
jgi:hypothetical protein